MKAVKEGNAEVLNDLIDDEFTLTSSLSTSPGGKEDWIALTRAGYVVESCRFKDIKIRVYNANVAVANSIYSQTATVNGADRSGDFLLTDVWVKKNGKWLLVARHSTGPIKKA